VIVRGEGIYVYDSEGRQYLESAAGLWCASLGFGNRRLADVAHQSMSTLGFYHTFRHNSNPAAIDLCEELLSIAPENMAKVLLQGSGSEANDTAIKLIWYYWDAVGQPHRRKIISREKSYHGSTIATASLTGKTEFHGGFGLPIPGFLRTTFPNYYREQRLGETEEQFTERAAADLEALIVSEGPDTIAAFFAEPVMGAAGAVLPPKGYFPRIQEVLHKYGILMVADEVICGFGRTGNMWGTQTFGMTPDLMASAKALSAAMQPISALLISDRIYQAMLVQSDRHNTFVHGYTYSGHPVAAAVALETLNIYREMDIAGTVKQVEPTFLDGLERLAAHPLVGDARGCGLIGGIELVRDKVTRETHPASANLVAKLDENGRRNGIILRIVGNRVALSPPLIISTGEIAEMFGRLTLTLDETAAQL